jgi:hypothetical protein
LWRRWNPGIFLGGRRGGCVLGTAAVEKATDTRKSVDD